jgi:hypothetical protein
MGVDDKLIIMFFKKGLRDSSLIRTLTMKKPRLLEEILSIANKCALDEDATLDKKEAKKDKKSSQSDQPDMSKGNDKRKHDYSVTNMVQPQCNRTKYWPQPREFEGFFDVICIFHPQGKHKTRDCNCLQAFADEVLKSAKKANQDKKPEDSKSDFPQGLQGG